MAFFRSNLFKIIFLPVLFWINLVSVEALAFKISPMVADFSIVANGLSQVFTLENPGKEKVPLQIEVTSREQDETGEEKRNPTKDFTIYPEQLVLQPGEKRNLRITYTGTQELKSEVPYRLIVTQLPIDFKKQKNEGNTKVNFLLQYVASLYVQPKAIKSAVRLKSFKVNGDKNLEIYIENAGTKRQMLIESYLQLTDGSKRILTRLDHPKEIEGLNVLAGGVRKVSVQVEKGIPSNLKNVELNFKQID